MPMYQIKYRSTGYPNSTVQRVTIAAEDPADAIQSYERQHPEFTVLSADCIWEAPVAEDRRS